MGSFGVMSRTDPSGDHGLGFVDLGAVGGISSSNTKVPLSKHIETKTFCFPPKTMLRAVEAENGGSATEQGMV